MIPPCINKFYILDLQPENSFVAHAVAAGHTVFMVSWRNVGPEQGHLSWDDYLEKGVFTALRVGEGDRGQRAGQRARLLRRRHAAWRGLGRPLAEETRIWSRASPSSPPCSTSPTPGRSACSSTRRASPRARRPSARGGIFPGADLAFVFSSLRANDLIWPYVVNNYLLGERAGGVRSALLERRQHQPAGADVLLLPAQHLPREQAARAGRADQLRRAGRSRQGRSCRCSCSRRARTTSCRGARPTGRLACSAASDKTFVLGASGHIAGVVNPAAKNGAATGSARRIRTIRKSGCRTRPRKAGQLVAGLDASGCRPASGGERARHRATAGNVQIQADRIGARSLREAETALGGSHGRHRTSSARRAPPIGKFGGSLAKTPGVGPRRAGHPQGARARGRRARAGLRGDPGPGAHRGRRPEPGAPGGDQGRPAAHDPVDDHQQGVRLGPQGGDARRAGDRQRRFRHRDRRRPGVDEPVAARADGLARRLPHGRREDGRHHDRRRPVGRLQPVPHGRHRRERGQGIRGDARGAGRVRGGEPEQGRGRAEGRPVQGRDRDGGDRRRARAR